MKNFTVPESVNWYSVLADMTQYASAPSKNLYDAETNVFYNRFTGTAQTHLNMMGGAGAGTWTAEKVDSGAYIAIKYRAQGGKFTVNIATKDFGAASETQPTRPAYKSVGDISGDETMGDWRIAVIKIPEGKNYTVNSEQEVGIMLLTDGKAYTIDLSYVAILDELSELSELLEEGEDYYYHGESFSNEGNLNATE